MAAKYLMTRSRRWPLSTSGTTLQLRPFIVRPPRIKFICLKQGGRHVERLEVGACSSRLPCKPRRPLARILRAAQVLQQYYLPIHRGHGLCVFLTVSDHN